MTKILDWKEVIYISTALWKKNVCFIRIFLKIFNRILFWAWYLFMLLKIFMQTKLLYFLNYQETRILIESPFLEQLKIVCIFLKVIDTKYSCNELGMLIWDMNLHYLTFYSPLHSISYSQSVYAIDMWSLYFPFAVFWHHLEQATSYSLVSDEWCILYNNCNGVGVSIK